MPLDYGSITDAIVADGSLILREVSGTFQDNENLQVSAVTKALAAGVAVETGATTDADDATWSQAAIEAARALIQKPAGSGPIRGVHVYGGVPYCVRDNGGAGVLYKATTSGWQAQSLGSYLKFDTGTAAFTAGETLTGGTSGHTATIVRVVAREGTTGDGDQTGLMILSGATGNFQNNETITSAAGSATADGTLTANALPAAGTYRFKNHNFFGASNLKRMYGVSGTGTGFEWDGSVFVPIFTGMTDDRPTHLAVHKGHLFFAFRGGSRQHSGTNDPYPWSAITGAAELGFGEDITGFAQDMAGLLITLGRNKIDALYGNDSSDWVLQVITDEAGGLEDTAQRVGNLLYMDDRGIRDLRTSANFGDFAAGTVSQAIRPVFEAKRRTNAYPVASIGCRQKNQYRVFFSDATGISVLLNDERGRAIQRCALFDFGEIQVSCACSGEDADGNEVMLLGAEDGYVYQLDAGTSLDGEAVPAFIRLSFNHCGTPAQNKRFHKAMLEGDFPADAQIRMTAEFDYGGADQPSVNEQEFSITGAGGLWDEDLWEGFSWDSAVEGRAECRLAGSGRNCSITVISEATYERPHLLHGLTLFHTPRRLVR